MYPLLLCLLRYSSCISTNRIGLCISSSVPTLNYHSLDQKLGCIDIEYWPQNYDNLIMFMSFSLIVSNYSRCVRFAAPPWEQKDLYMDTKFELFKRVSRMIQCYALSDDGFLQSNQVDNSHIIALYERLFVELLL